MGLLRLTVLGPPEVFYDDRRLTFALRKAQALLLYLAIEGNMHPRSKLAAFFWPDSEPHQARNALRNAIALLRRLLTDADPTLSQHSHLLSSQELLGLDSQTAFELDLQVVQLAFQQALPHATLPPEEQYAALVAHVEQALSLIRGPLLDGFWLGEDAPFDEWVQQQQQHWQMQVSLLLDRLSCWHEAAGELEQAQAVLTRWLTLEPLQEEAYRRLMRVQVTRGDATVAWQTYLTCRTQLAETLQIKPSAETVTLARHIRTIAALPSTRLPVHPASAQRQLSSDLVAPLIGRSTAFRQLVTSFQLARDGQPQAVLVAGEAGIGKTRLSRDFASWARVQGAEVLCGQAFESGGRLPYQPLIEALQSRLEVENAPEDLLEDLWLAELSRLLPELRVRYPDLPVPIQDDLTAKPRLFEAVARLFDALARPGPLLLFLDDLHWGDEISLDLLHYLGHSWQEHGNRVLLLGTVRGEMLELHPELAATLADLGRNLPLTQITLQPLNQVETLHLLSALVGEGVWHKHGPAQSSQAGSEGEPLPAHEQVTLLQALGDFLFAQTEGQPLYLVETLKLLRERGLLVPRLGTDDTWRLEPTVGLMATIEQEQFRRALVPPSVRMLIQARWASLSPAVCQLIWASAVLGTAASAQLLWHLAEMEVSVGVEALEEAVRSGMLREEAGERGRPASYRFPHELIHEVVYSELGSARRQVLHQRALVLLQNEGVRASELAVHALAAGETEAAYRLSVQAGMEAGAVFAVEDAIGHYEQARALLQEHKRLKTELSASEVERLYAHLGRAYANQNAWEKAQQAYEELLAHAQQKSLPTLVCLTLNCLAILEAQHSPDKSQVRTLLEQAWQVAQSSHDQQALAETEWNLAQIIGIVWYDPTSALPHGVQALELARASHNQELEARSLASVGVIHLLKGDFQKAMHYAEASLALYARLSNEPIASRELSVAHFLTGAPPTQPLTNRASEALCWSLLAFAQAHAGQVHESICSGHRALTLAQESKNVWAKINNIINLTHGLLEVGAYEEALGLTQRACAFAQRLPPTLIFQRFLMALGGVYQALQQWDEARSTLEEASTMAEKLDLRPLQVVTLSQLCMNRAVAGQWEQAHTYAVHALAIRKHLDWAMILLDFSPQYETEALLRGRDERQARELVLRLGERVGANQRYCLPYLQSRARLSIWDGHCEQAIGQLREAARLATDLGLPGEQWQIQVTLGTVYEARGKPPQAHTAWASAARIIQRLAEGIKDEMLRTRFLAGPQIQLVRQHIQSEASSVLNDHTEPKQKTSL